MEVSRIYQSRLDLFAPSLSLVSQSQESWSMCKGLVTLRNAQPRLPFHWCISFSWSQFSSSWRWFPSSDPLPRFWGLTSPHLTSSCPLDIFSWTCTDIRNSPCPDLISAPCHLQTSLWTLWPSGRGCHFPFCSCIPFDTRSPMSAPSSPSPLPFPISIFDSFIYFLPSCVCIIPLFLRLCPHGLPWRNHEYQSEVALALNTVSPTASLSPCAPG